MKKFILGVAALLVMSVSYGQNKALEFSVNSVYFLTPNGKEYFKEIDLIISYQKLDGKNFITINDKANSQFQIIAKNLPSKHDSYEELLSLKVYDLENKHECDIVFAKTKSSGKSFMRISNRYIKEIDGYLQSVYHLNNDL